AERGKWDRKLKSARYSPCCGLIRRRSIAGDNAGGVGIVERSQHAAVGRSIDEFRLRADSRIERANEAAGWIGLRKVIAVGEPRRRGAAAIDIQGIGPGKSSTEFGAVHRCQLVVSNLKRALPGAAVGDKNVEMIEVGLNVAGKQQVKIPPGHHAVSSIQLRS